MPDTKETVWLRPEFQGRDHELISFSEFVALAGVERPTVRQWMTNYDHFPQPVKEVPFGNGPARYYLPGEVAAWLLNHRPRMADPAREKARLRVALAELGNEIHALESQLRHKTSVYEQLKPILED